MEIHKRRCSTGSGMPHRPYGFPQNGHLPIVHLHNVINQLLYILKMYVTTYPEAARSDKHIPLYQFIL